MQQLDLFDTLVSHELPHEDISWAEKQIFWVQDTIKTQTSVLLDRSYNYSFTKGRITSYKVDVENGNIKKVLFHIGKESFQVFLNYRYESKDIVQRNYTETDPEEREKIIKTIQIRNLKVEWLQKKVSVWYGEFKQSANYFKHLGLDTNSLIIFLEELIKKFHTNT